MKPSSIVHFPLRRRSIWRVLRSLRSWSITSSRGSTFFARFTSLFTNAFIDMSSISLTALTMTGSSLRACCENLIFLLCISSAASTMFTAWSEMRSRSPIVCSMLDTILLSFSERSFELIFRIYEPILSSKISIAFSLSITSAHFFAS